MTAGITVLVVEDDSLIRMAISSDLEDAGFLVHEAEDAAAAIVLLVNCPEINILFTDVDMPGDMNGLKLAAAVRDRWPPIHIIVTSAYRDVTAASLPVPSQFFSKPYCPDAVMRSMRAMSAAA
jgi:CheY-like chemotaxis protein